MSHTDLQPLRTSARVAREPPRPARIIVADDDAELLGLLADSLREDGYQVVAEADGGRLLVRIAAIYSFGQTADPIDLIVSDIRMPVCTGLDILLGLRNAHWATPVILMTAYGDGDVRARAKHLGAVVLEKPFEASQLRAKVKELLFGSTDLAAPARAAARGEGGDRKGKRPS